jgi:methionyl-tRNA formyltransferase
MRLVFFGTATFAIPALRQLAPYVQLVVTQPDAPSGRGSELKQTPVAIASQELQLPLEKPVKCRAPEFVERIREIEPEALVVAAYGQILSEKLLNTALRGGINIHGSLLPKFRGAAPVQRAIEAGELFTGVTLMQMEKGLDTGDIIASELISIGPDETAGELFERLAEAGADLASAWLPQITAGGYPRTPQNAAETTYAAKMVKEDGRITPDMTSQAAYNRFRAATPSPGAWIATSRGSIKILACRPVSGLKLTPGKVAAVKPDLVVGLADGGLCLDLVQPEGRRGASGVDFANGARLGIGSSLMKWD